MKSDNETFFLFGKTRREDGESNAFFLALFLVVVCLFDINYDGFTASFLSFLSLIFFWLRKSFAALPCRTS